MIKYRELKGSQKFDEELSNFDAIAERKCLKYHYSDLGPIKSILSEKFIRLTSHDALDDKTEGKYLIDSLVDDFSNEVNLDILLELYRASLKNLFICSFCSYGNKEDLWKEYGEINVGFDYYFMAENPPKPIIDKTTTDQNCTAGLIFSPVKYIDQSDEEFEEMISSIINKFKNVTADHIRAYDQFQYYALTLGSMIFDYKKNKYKFESEFRIFHFLWNKKSFIDNGKKYINFRFAPNVVKRIIIGPYKNAEKNLFEIKEFINQQKPLYDHVEIVRIL